MPFRDIVGHRKLVALLARSVARQTLPPSLIFAGPSGVGKQLAALATAQALNCLAPLTVADAESGDPMVDACGTCAACTRIARGVHPDVLVIRPNEKGNIKIEPIRDAIDRAGYRPFEGRRRVTIIDSADGLETSAQNALLKILEEPPASSVFVLVTSLPDTLLQTVRSRCPQLRFRGLEMHEVVTALQRLKRGLEEQQAYRAASTAEGSVGVALAATDADDEDHDVRDVAYRVLLQAAMSDDGRKRMESAKELVPKASGSLSERDLLALHLRAMSALLRDVELMTSGAGTGALANRDLAGALERLSPFGGDRGRQAFQAVDRALASIERYANAKIVADWLVLQL